jgi:hypothetical protein
LDERRQQQLPATTKAKSWRRRGEKKASWSEYHLLLKTQTMNLLLVTIEGLLNLSSIPTEILRGGSTKADFSSVQDLAKIQKQPGYVRYFSITALLLQVCI